jgi:RimJ/RimL family protein N-acetyltransferase
MRIYSIKRDEVELFTSVKGGSHFTEVVNSLWENNQSRPEWCFVIKDREQVIGRIGFWADSGVTDTVRVFGLYIVPDDSIPIGTTLLKDALDRMIEQGTIRISAQVNSKETNHKSYEQIYLSSGFELYQEKLRFTLHQSAYTPVVEQRLQYKTLQDVGVETYVNAIKLVSKNTFDLDDQKTIAEFGEDEAAKQYFACLQDIDYTPLRWKLGYVQDRLVGLVVPQAFDEKVGAINYIGVVPEERGKGYSLDLLSAGAESLFQVGINEVIADIDRDNLPLKKNLSIIGFNKQHCLRFYHKRI